MLGQHLIGPALSRPLVPRVGAFSIVPVHILTTFARLAFWPCNRDCTSRGSGRRKRNQQPHLELHTSSPMFEWRSRQQEAKWCNAFVKDIRTHATLKGCEATLGRKCGSVSQELPIAEGRREVVTLLFRRNGHQGVDLLACQVNPFQQCVRNAPDRCLMFP